MVTVDAVVADAVDRATDGLLTLSQANEQLVGLMRGVDPSGYDREHLDALRAAVCFELTPDGTFRGDFAGSGPVPWPRTLEEIAPQVQALWQAYAEHVHDPWLRAHLHDLLRGAGARPIHIHARAAISAYRDAVPVFLAAVDRNRGRLRAVRALTRALDLAVEMNQRDLRPQVAGDILTLVADLLAADPVPYGLVLELLESLHARRLEAGAVRDLVERILAACSEIFLQIRFLGMLRAMNRDPAAQKAVDRRIVTAMTAHADRTSGALRLGWLNDAATAARDAGLTDLHEEIALTMQRVPRASLGLVPTGRLVVQFTDEERDAALAEVDQAKDLAEALWRIAVALPPTGTIAVAQHMARGLIVAAPFASVVARGSLNPAGPVPVAPAGSDALADVQAECQRYALHKSGFALAAQLERVRERFEPDGNELAVVLAHPLLGSPSKTLMLVHALQYFWAGEDDASVHLALPRVEALLREIERGRGVPVLAVARGNTPGGVSQLGALIGAMPDAGFDQDWTRSFALLLHDGERGLNLRNDIGHGLCDCPPRHLVALVLHAALFLLAVAHGLVPLPQRPALMAEELGNPPPT